MKVGRANIQQIQKRNGKKKIEAALENKEKEKWEKETGESSRLKTYKRIKKRKGAEKYLENKDVVGRSIMGRLRAGANFLRIETGRKKGEKPEERICRTCIKGIEDEEHFIIKCEGYTAIREEYKKKIEEIEKN